MFDPYMQFGMSPNMPGTSPAFTPFMPQLQMQNADYMLGAPVNLKDFYEQQIIYYRYLTSIMEYNIKLKEYDRYIGEKNKAQ